MRTSTTKAKKTAPVEAEPKTFPEVLSPRVNKLIERFQGKTVTPALFRELLKAMKTELTAEERIEFTIFQTFSCTPAKAPQQ